MCINQSFFKYPAGNVYFSAVEMENSKRFKKSLTLCGEKNIVNLSIIEKKETSSQLEKELGQKSIQPL